MIETREKLIDGATYLVTQLPARRAIKLQTKLIKLLGSLFISNDSTSFQSMLLNLNENDFEALCMEMIQGVRKNNVELTPATFDLEFAGDMAGLYKLLFFIVEVNFSNFLELVGIGLPSFNQIPIAETGTKKTFGKK